MRLTVAWFSPTARTSGSSLRSGPGMRTLGTSSSEWVSSSFSFLFSHFFSFYRALPNWTELREKDPEKIDYSDQRNVRETSILKSKMGTYVIQGHEILNDSNQLRSLGLLQESMVSRKKS